MSRIKVFELRPHHLGIIYNFVAEKGVPKDNILKKVNDFVEASYGDTNYPKTTKLRARFILEDFVYDKQISIKIVSGPDDVCMSGCIQKSQEFIREIDYGDKDRHLKGATNRKMFGLCENKMPEEDSCMLSAYGLKIDTAYLREEVLNRTLCLINKHGFKNWRDLLPFYSKNKLEEPAVIMVDGKEYMRF